MATFLFKEKPRGSHSGGQFRDKPISDDGNGFEWVNEVHCQKSSCGYEPFSFTWFVYPSMVAYLLICCFQLVDFQVRFEEQGWTMDVQIGVPLVVEVVHGFYRVLVRKSLLTFPSCCEKWVFVCQFQKCIWESDFGLGTR